MMRRITTVAIFAGVIALAGCKKSELGGGAGKQYTCPMHAEVVQDKPGDCPKCGMKLIEKH